jgi:Cu-Zn family superoxide dismutase
MTAKLKGLVATAFCIVTALATIGFIAHRGADAEDVTMITKAICVLAPTADSKVSGTVTFTQQTEGVLIEAHITGLKPNAKHGFHIHEFGDISKPDGTGAGGHFNPGGHEHGAPDVEKRHAGDLGNLEADASGHAMYKRVDKVVELNGVNCILGRGLIVHAGTDDLKTQPTGDAGARAAQGVIGVAKP